MLHISPAPRSTHRLTGTMLVTYIPSVAFTLSGRYVKLAYPGKRKMFSIPSCFK
ncbi:hypothetical protein BU26DRAFT_513818, partial [Trematosphaeria pertusa]